jgi:two-component system, chemotaxis family, chemotaxis protein CheY
MAHRILLVDDSSTMRSFVAAVLEADGGYDLTQVPNGFAALKALPMGRFDLVITDVNMPDINGLELIKFIRSSPLYQATPLVIISTEGRDRDRDRGLSLGANAYLVKPFTPEALLEVVHRFLPAATTTAP